MKAPKCTTPPPTTPSQGRGHELRLGGGGAQRPMGRTPQCKTFWGGRGSDKSGDKIKQMQAPSHHRASRGRESQACCPSLGLSLCRPHFQKVLLKTGGRPLLKAFCWLPATLRLTEPTRPHLGGWSLPAFSSLASDPPASTSRLLTPGRLAFFSSSDGPHWLHLQPSALLPTAPHLAHSSDFFRPETAPSSQKPPVPCPSALPSQGPGHPDLIRTIYHAAPLINRDLHGGRACLRPRPLTSAFTK